MPVLQFKGKSAIESYHHTVAHHSLEIDPKLSLAKKPGLDGNLIIEGDNLLALKSLLPTHAGRIKCVYIDPPYNTGNEGWIYNDNLTQPQFKEWIGKTVGKEGEDASRHDKWCCMMYPRLQLLRELLTEDGAIFISIDDNEVASLRMMMDEIFGASNRLACIIWQKKQSPQSDAINFSEMHDYILAYAKRAKDDREDSTGWSRNLLPRGQAQESRYSNPDRDPRGNWTSSDATCNKTADERPNLYYPVKNPNSGRMVKPSRRRVWLLERKAFQEAIDEGRVWWGQTGDSFPRLKAFRSEVAEGVVPSTWWTREDCGDNQDARREFRELFSEKEDVYVTPKPTKLIRRILQISTDANSIVLDSFSGSGTTGDAVLKMNDEDSGNRKFILVQIPHETEEQDSKQYNICERITRERVARVIQRVDSASKKLSTGFTYARIGKPLYDEHRDLGDKPPSYQELARYVWYTETSRPFEPGQVDEKSGLIGKLDGVSYYLLYSPGSKDAPGLDTAWLKNLKDRNPRKVVYCEKIWLHREDLKQFGDIRPMLVPFNLK